MHFGKLAIIWIVATAPALAAMEAAAQAFVTIDCAELTVDLPGTVERHCQATPTDGESFRQESARMTKLGEGTFQFTYFGPRKAGSTGFANPVGDMRRFLLAQVPPEVLPRLDAPAEPSIRDGITHLSFGFGAANATAFVRFGPPRAEGHEYYIRGIFFTDKTQGYRLDRMIELVKEITVTPK